MFLGLRLTAAEVTIRDGANDRTRYQWWAARSILGCFVLLSQAVAVEAAGPSFSNDVRPILSEKCFHCHGPDEQSRAADLRLDVRDEAIDFGAIVPNDSADSTLVERIESNDEDLQMPPSSSKRFLTEEEKETLRRWIDSGAEYEEHWSLEPLPREVSVPGFDRATDPEARWHGWPRQEIDKFVLRAQLAQQMTPNDEAGRNAWLRRVTFDLTGLPPTLDEVDAFVKDQTPDAYERVVDRLLVSDAYAERMASEWLDVARYADTYGYQRDDERFVWPWRDWVIDSFRKNQPYDEFVTWQLAGDLLPDATQEQRLATTFCRLHSHKKEGGVAVEEFRVENVADRTHTFSSAMLGLTVECARCHDHKYDPISAKDYYQLSAFFANIDERGLISYFTDATPTPAMPLPTEEQASELAGRSERVTAAEESLARAEEAAVERFEAWLSHPHDQPPVVDGLVAWVDFDQSAIDPPEELLVEEDTGFVEVERKPLDRTHVLAFQNACDSGLPAITNDRNQVTEGKSGQGVLLTGDDSIVIPAVGHIERHEPLSFSLWIKPSEVTERSVLVRRSGGWDDAGSIGYALIKTGGRLRFNAVHFWPGNAICVETDEVLTPQAWRHITVTYDGSSRAEGLRIFVDGENATARIVQDHLTRTISDWRGGYQDLAIGSRYRDRGFKDGVVDGLRVYDRELTSLEVRHEFDGEALSDAFEAIGSRDLSDKQRAELQDYYLAKVDAPVRKAKAELSEARLAWNQAMDATQAIMVMREQPVPRKTYYLERGGYDARGDVVIPDTPSALPPYPAELQRDRLGLAEWLFQPDHPLTARVAVNRYWQMLFGEGLVRTPEDFGSQGAPPTHPDLLDWLARDFVESGWDVRRLLRQMVLSSTYRQGSAVDPEVRDRDPENRLLTRGPGKPLSAEMIRDGVLAVSGLLIDRVGGPPVKPYDLPLAYTPVEADRDQGLYRRSLYTFWKRTSPSPVMITMNANRREVCQLKRQTASSPLQAFVLLNGVQFNEASRVLAERLLRNHGQQTEAIAIEAFRLLTSRQPSDREVEVLLRTYEEQLAEFQSEPQLADDLLSVGLAPLSEPGSKPRLAAVTVLVNVIMNFDESVRCR